MQFFYQQQRKNLKILVNENNEPLGKQWSFDEQNRESLPKNIPIPTYYAPYKKKHFNIAKKIVEKKFKNNPGEISTFDWPLTHTQAKRALLDFLENRLYYFGKYQDAISTHHTTLFHSRLSPLLNSGLLTPEYVIKKTLAFSKKNNVPLNSTEGFIRQIIGWREFIYGMYHVHGRKQEESNYWSNHRQLSKAWWNATVGIQPVDASINNTLNHAYAHHIERLMILGNFMLLSEHDPKSIYRWFMELFIDAYDWVMIPNIYGMSQFADGGLMATKPYISGSSYVKKMSNFKNNTWSKIWDALFWNFLHKHEKKITKEVRFKFLLATLKHMNPATLKKHKKIAKDFLETLD